MKLTDYALSLSGIAVVVLAIGMGVDANILIYERMREELDEGKSVG
jgi:preprotein translocase subunit SecD